MKAFPVRPTFSFVLTAAALLAACSSSPTSPGEPLDLASGPITNNSMTVTSTNNNGATVTGFVSWVDLRAKLAEGMQITLGVNPSSEQRPFLIGVTHAGDDPLTVQTFGSSGTIEPGETSATFIVRAQELFDNRIASTDYPLGLPDMPANRAALANLGFPRIVMMSRGSVRLSSGRGSGLDVNNADPLTSITITSVTTP